MMEEWGQGRRDDSLAPLPRERPLHPSQLGSLSPKLVGKGASEATASAQCVTGHDRAEPPQTWRCSCPEPQSLNP